ncbi:MAG TPA: MerR family transcriptional regulator [Polyangiaceae bacterium]|jgi:DNA-binding transcriptional MerR regulator|nr:MerR family transcriptional regulator [Polyangiaceae bacterium]
MTEREPTAESPSSTRAYRISDVARAVGVSTHALRAWERRYGTVEPRRTKGGSRRYDAAQIERLKALKKLTDLGHAIRHVARLPHEELERLLAGGAELSPSR